VVGPPGVYWGGLNSGRAAPILLRSDGLSLWKELTQLVQQVQALPPNTPLP
jgi:hypothetical protein